MPIPSPTSDPRPERLDCHSATCARCPTCGDPSTGRGPCDVCAWEARQSTLARPLDAATLASQSMPRADAGLGATLWDMFSQTHRPT